MTRSRPSKSVVRRRRSASKKLRSESAVKVSPPDAGREAARVRSHLLDFSRRMTVCSIKAGRAVVGSCSEATGELRGWQSRAYDDLKDRRLRIINTPTGSGKSFLCKMLGTNDLASGYKVVVAYPQELIARSLGFEEGITSSWRPIKPDSRRVQIVVDYLTGSSTGGAAEPPLLCTHAALCAAFAEVTRDGGRLASGLSLFIDEAHHASSGTEANQLGRVVNEIMKESSSRLTLVTATWFRQDGFILSPDALAEFSRFRLPFHEHLASMEHLSEININFVIGPREDALGGLLADDANRETLVFLPRGMVPREKTSLLKRCRRLARESGVRRDLDLVTFERRVDGMTRERRVEVFGKHVASGSSETPQVVWVQNMFVEGADWPRVSRVIMLSPRYSLREFAQIVGRTLRDCEGKEDVEIDIIIEPAPNVSVKAESISTYLRTLLVAMVIDWTMVEGPNRFFSDPDFILRFIGDLSREALRAGGTMNDVFERAFDVLARDFPDVAGEKESLRAMASDFNARARSALLSLGDLPEVEIKDGIIDTPAGAFVAFFAVLTGKSLKDMEDNFRTVGSDVTMPLIWKWCLGFKGANGKWPSSSSEDASRLEGREDHHEKRYDAWLRRCRGMTLAQFVDLMSGRRQPSSEVASQGPWLDGVFFRGDLIGPALKDAKGSFVRVRLAEGVVGSWSSAGESSFTVGAGFVANVRCRVDEARWLYFAEKVGPFYEIERSARGDEIFISTRREHYPWHKQLPWFPLNTHQKVGSVLDGRLEMMGHEDYGYGTENRAYFLVSGDNGGVVKLRDCAAVRRLRDDIKNVEAGDVCRVRIVYRGYNDFSDKYGNVRQRWHLECEVDYSSVCSSSNRSRCRDKPR